MKVFRTLILAVALGGVAILLVSCDQTTDVSNPPKATAPKGPPKVPGAPPGVAASTGGNGQAAPQ